MGQAPKRHREVGVLWAHQSEKGRTYWSGTIFGRTVYVFRNDHKTKDGQPDLIVFKAPKIKKFQPQPKRTEEIENG